MSDSSGSTGDFGLDESGFDYEATEEENLGAFEAAIAEQQAEMAGQEAAAESEAQEESLAGGARGTGGGKPEKAEKTTKDEEKTEKTTAGSEKKKRRPMFLGLDESWFAPIGQAKTLKEKLGE